MSSTQAAATRSARIAYQGVAGAFSETAALQFSPGGDAVGYPSFEEAFRAAVRGDCAYACLPVENAVCGADGQAPDDQTPDRQTYVNACEARCQGAEILHEGPCAEE